LMLCMTNSVPSGGAAGQPIFSMGEVFGKVFVLLGGERLWAKQGFSTGAKKGEGQVMRGKKRTTHATVLLALIYI
ncbi:hypothetical protein UP92_28010, partial [Escherichia coli]